MSNNLCTFSSFHTVFRVFMLVRNLDWTQRSPLLPTYYKIRIDLISRPLKSCPILTVSRLFSFFFLVLLVTRFITHSCAKIWLIRRWFFFLLVSNTPIDRSKIGFPVKQTLAQWYSQSLIKLSCIRYHFLNYPVQTCGYKFYALLKYETSESITHVHILKHLGVCLHWGIIIVRWLLNSLRETSFFLFARALHYKGRNNFTISVIICESKCTLTRFITKNHFFLDTHDFCSSYTKTSRKHINTFSVYFIYVVV